MSYRVDLIWNDQAGTTETVEKFQIAEIISVAAFVATLGITQKKLLLFEISKNIKLSNIESRKFKGLEIQLFQTGGTTYLAIILLENTLSDIFVRLSEDILTMVSLASTQKDAVKRIFQVINNWRKLFESSITKGLTVEQQKGLYGELLTIKSLLQQKQSAKLILDAWTGPEAKNYDFTFSAFSLEVKASSANHPSIMITNEHQLSTINKLYLLLFVLTEKRGNRVTLPNLIDEIRAFIYETSSNLQEAFDTKLCTAGYFDEHRKLYEYTEYVIRKTLCYEVGDDFPKIIPDNLMEGIYAVSYQIEISSCDNSLVDFPLTIIEQIKNEKVI